MSLDSKAADKANPPGLVFLRALLQDGGFLRTHTIIVPLLLLFGTFTILTPRFIDVANLINILRQISVLSIISVGATFVIISGGIDLSVGSVMALVGVFVAKWIQVEPHFFGMTLLALVFGLVIGLINGLFIANFTVPPFIVTLATMTIGRGVVLLWTGGVNVTELSNKDFLFLGRGSVAGVPFPFIVMCVVLTASIVSLMRSKFGRKVFAIGNNEQASYVAGINVKNVRIVVYMIAGLTAAIGAIISVSRMNTVTPMFGSGIEFECITAVVLGGTAISGGKGNLFNTVLGAALLGVINNGFNLIGISSYWTQIAKGIILIATIIVSNVNIRMKTE